MRKSKDEAREVFRQFAWHLAGRLVPAKPAPGGKR